MSTAAEALISEALKALEADPARAETLCRAALEANPANGDARLVLSEALRRKGDLPAARALAASEVQARPNWFGAHRQLGVILADMREPLPAALALRAAAELNPAHPTIWRDLGDQLNLAGDAPAAQQAFARYGAMTPGEPRLRRAAEALQANDVATGENIVTAFLKQHPNDIQALRLLSEAYARSDRTADAEAALRRCLEIAPRFTSARHHLTQLLMGLGRLEEALAEAQRLLQQSPGNHGARRLQAAVLGLLGRNEEAVEIYQALLAEDPAHAGMWVSYGHALKTVGRAEEGLKAYRRGIECDPGSGVAYWSIANLKTAALTTTDVVQMREQLARPDLTIEERVAFFYALGKAREDAGDAGGAFKNYAEGAALHRANVRYDPDRFSAFVARSRAQLTPDFFAARAGGCGAPDPIFIVGLPRAGSTLIEQILASHSAVEGTQELGDLNAIAQRLTEEGGGEFYLDRMAELSATERAALGETYLRTTRVQRRMGRPLFINKMPNDFRHIGLIQLILPNAKIIDARRHPMACGFSCFKQHFALGQTFTYDLAELGRYYADYVALMAHYDAVLPGRVHRVIHEELATDPEPRIRALLDYCGLPFEEACLRPHENERAVRTPSAEQVRKPISAKGLDDWRKFEPYLEPLKRALGPVLDSYPKAP